MNYIGEFIKQYRGDMSLRDFADKCGISHTHLDSIEKGYDPRTGKPVNVTVETLKKIAKAMKMSINDLLIQSGDVKFEDLQFDNASPEYELADEYEQPKTELEILFSKAKDKLSDETYETMKFLMEKTIRNYEESKKNQ